MRKNLLTLIGLSLGLGASAQSNMLYVTGGAVVTVKDAPTTQIDRAVASNPGLYVAGDVTILSTGSLTNQGEMQVTGSFVNAGTFTSTGDDVFTGSTVTQTLSGALTGTNAFYNFILNKSAGTLVQLATNVEAANSINFASSGRIRTDNVGFTTDDGNTYDYFMGVRNAATNAITGYAPLSYAALASQNNYIEGKLRRAITSGSYDFPVGTGANSGFVDFYEPYNINVTSAPASATVIGYYGKGEGATPQPSMVSGVAFCDIYKPTGSVPPQNGATIQADTFNIDGIEDKLTLDCEFTGSWYGVASSNTGWNYDLTVYAGPNTRSACNFVKPWTLAGKSIAYLCHNGQVFDVPATVQNSWNVAGAYVCPNTNRYAYTGITTGFSPFRLAGVTQKSNVALPIELLSLTATPVDNDYIRVDWATATERNTNHFDIQRSRDGIMFNTIATLAAAGNSNERRDYAFDDHNVLKNTNYYYRIKTTDHDGSEEYTYIVTARLHGNDSYDVALYPNPSNHDLVTLDISSSAASDINISVTNVLGQLITSQNQTLSNGLNQYYLNTRSWSIGTYFVSIVKDGTIQTIKLVVQE